MTESQRAVPETLLGLVERYSPSGDERAAVTWLVRHMEALGFGRAFEDEVGNAVGILGEGDRKLVMLGHIDTVPGEIAVRVEGGSLHGRGTVDAKGPLAAFVDAAAGAGAIPGWQIYVIGAVDEERDSRGARHVLESVQPDLVIVGEPSGWERLTLGYKGIVWVDIRVERPARHPASQVASASQQAIAGWVRVQAWVGQLNQGKERAFDQVTPSLEGLASGGNGLKEWAILRIATRLPVGLPVEQWLAALTDLFSDGQVTQVGFPVEAYRAPKNTSLVRMFLRSIRKAGGRPGFLVKTGTADLNIVGPVWGCPALAYGPGDSSLDHTPNEHLSLEEYHRSVAVLNGVLAQLPDL